jgi:predicted dehydrogenase
MTRLFICGFGHRARQHVTALAEAGGSQVAGVFDTAPAMRAHAQSAGFAAFSDLEDGLRRSRPDMALVCTPPSVRLQLVETLAGTEGIRRIVVEKPLAVTVDEARAMLRACERRGVALTVSHQLRFCDEFAALKAAVQGGRLGDVLLMRASCFGKLFDQGSHLVDQLCWLMGASRVAWVDATATDELASLARLSALPAGFHADTVHPGALWTHALLRFDNGTEATLSCGLLQAMTRGDLGPWLQKRVTVLGTRGAAEAHVAAHFREWRAGQAVESIATSTRDYEASLTRLYQAMFDPGRDDAEALGRAEDQLHVLEVLAAIVESGRRRQPVAVAEVTAGARTGIVTEPRRGPTVSVIVPMEDHRGLGLRAVESWTVAQRCVPEEFELIVLSDRSTAGIEDGIRALLRPQDRLLSYDGVNEMDQYHHGATLARGEILLFTEPHCIAEPEAIGELIEQFRTKAIDAACGRSEPLCENAIAVAEKEMFEQGFVEWSKAGAWQKVILRAFAIRRQLYFEVGGYLHQYSRFSEWLFAATLHQRGHAVAYLPGVGVTHLYGGDYPLFDHFIQEFTDGECKFRVDSNDSELCLQYFGAPAEWTEARSLNQRIARQGLRNLLGLLVRPRRTAGSLCGYALTALQFLRGVPLAMLGGRLLVWRWRCRIWYAKLRFLLAPWSAARRARAFQDYYSHTTSLFRVRYALAAGEPDGNVEEAGADGSTASIPSRDLLGFHPPEVYNGARFRWSSGLSAVRLMLSPGRQRVELSLLAVRTVDPVRHAAFFLNGRLLTDVAADASGCRVSIGIEPRHLDGSQAWLMMCVRPWRLPRRIDPRELGLAVLAIAVRSDGGDPGDAHA